MKLVHKIRDEEGGHAYLAGLGEAASPTRRNQAQKDDMNAQMGAPEGCCLSVLAARVYLAMRFTSMPQTVLVTNTCALLNGKREAVNFNHHLRLIGYLCAVYSPQQQKVHAQILAAHSVLACLGCTQHLRAPRLSASPLIAAMALQTTLYVDHASFGRSVGGRGVVGAFIKVLCVDKLYSVTMQSKLDNQPHVLLPFAIFKMCFFFDTVPEHQQHLLSHLRIADWRIPPAYAEPYRLTQSPIPVEHLLSALVALNMAPDTIGAFFNCVVGIWHLFQIQFEPGRRRSIVTPQQHLIPAADLLGIGVDALSKFLMSYAPAILSSTTPISPASASLTTPADARTATVRMAAGLYAGLISWIVELANNSMGQPKENSALTVNIYFTGAKKDIETDADPYFAIFNDLVTLYVDSKFCERVADLVESCNDDSVQMDKINTPEFDISNHDIHNMLKIEADYGINTIFEESKNGVLRGIYINHMNRGLESTNSVIEFLKGIWPSSDTVGAPFVAVPPALADTLSVFESCLLFENVVRRYRGALHTFRIPEGLHARDKVKHLCASIRVPTSSFRIGRNYLWVSSPAIRILESEQSMSRDVFVPDAPKKLIAQEVDAVKPLIPRKTKTRRIWVMFVRFTTFLVPERLLRYTMPNENVRMAWREKVTICWLIFLLSCFVLFVIIGAGLVICPSTNTYSLGDLSYLAANPKHMFAAIYGNVYSITQLIATGSNAQHTAATLTPLAGFDITPGFARNPNTYCPSLVSNSIQLIYQNPDTAAFQFISASHTTAGTMIESYLSNNRKGILAIDLATISKGWSDSPQYYYMIVYKNFVYDLAPYYGTLSVMNNAAQYKFLGPKKSANPKDNIDDYIRVKTSAGVFDFTGDATFKALFKGDTAACMNSLFVAGVLDLRNSLQCQFANYILFAFSVLLVAIIGFKFFAALQIGMRGQVPANMDKFVIIQVPCYTENEASMRSTIDSVVATSYDDKRKLLVVICDGMIVGRGNDKPTPAIVLSVLGFDTREIDPPALPYQAVGEGRMQYNTAKLYSGLYDHKGHLVPYLVVVKCGNDAETVKPGNRGKRDSQMILMRFLNHLHHNAPMSPLELEMQHHIQHIIGVDPKWYEFLLMIDADTVVFPDSITQLVAYSMTDSRIVGICGETKLANEKQSLATMIQVYEYFISHHVSKAFESLFGSVTCLPGCFCMYRIFFKSSVFLASNDIIRDYSDVVVDTLHKKNLLSLGEDRFLTTLLLKNFPHMKTKFTPLAVAHTFAPENFSVLLSQRRRWINSTIHNLLELVTLRDMCGFCCFSMRFIVFIDLISTTIMPATIIYLVYLIYLTVNSLVNGTGFNTVTVSLIMLAAIYGLQAIVFLIKREFGHVVWMIIYLLALPIFGMFLPLYSFWHMDDFTWGSTRRTLDKSEKIKELGTFDISQIPHARWDDYERQIEPKKRTTLIEKQHNTIIQRASFIQQVNRKSINLPDDNDLKTEIRRILNTSDLNSTTKRQVREELSKEFGMDLEPYKDWVNKTIEIVLLELTQ